MKKTIIKISALSIVLAVCISTILVLVIPNKIDIEIKQILPINLIIIILVLTMFIATIIIISQYKKLVPQIKDCLNS